jgi:hypothetical protein
MSGSLRSDLFGDLLAWEQRADLVLALGTSLCGMNADRVFTTASEKARSGDPAVLGGVIISIQQTVVDHLCALRIFAKLDDVMTLLSEMMGILIPPDVDYRPDFYEKQISENDVFEVPYDRRSGKKIVGLGKTVLDLRVGKKIKVTGGPYFGTRGVVIRKSVHGHYDLELDCVGKSVNKVVKLGSWWVHAAVNGTVEIIPIVSIR